ncbi:MAG TPA: GTP-binding protein [Pseudonocardiaceae bacterium]|nr:GTP-binding protein [Pseudonocardiaceae bacterium]
MSAIRTKLVAGLAAEAGRDVVGTLATTSRTTVVLDRLAPSTPRARIESADATALLASIPIKAPCGRGNDPHGQIPPGQPLAGPRLWLRHHRIQRPPPISPKRLHVAIGELLDGVVRTRGRIWVATQPHTTLWLAIVDKSTWDHRNGRRWPRC